MPPAEYVERVRLEAARRALAEGDDPVAAVARRCGFGTAESLRRAFHRQLGVAPSDYRDRFRSTRRVHMTTYGLLIFDGAEELDFAGPWEVFTVSAMLRDQGDTAVLIAEQAGPVRCAKGMRVLPDSHPGRPSAAGRAAGAGRHRHPPRGGQPGAHRLDRPGGRPGQLGQQRVHRGAAAARGRPGPRPPGGHPPCVRGHPARPRRHHRGPGRPLRGGRERGHQPGRVGRDRHGAVAGRPAARPRPRPAVRRYIQYEPAPPYLADEPLAPLAG